MEKYRYKVVSRTETEQALDVVLEGADLSLTVGAKLHIGFRKFDVTSMSERQPNPRYPSTGFELGAIVELGATSVKSSGETR